MSGAAITTLYDLLIYWGIALFSALISKPLRMPPLLFYLILGAVVGNLKWVHHSDSLEFFAEWAITIVFFSLGFEETVEHFLHGIKKAWGIALIGALVPFGCGWLSGVIFFGDEGWWIHLTIATAVTATAVSLTMIVLKSVGLLRSKAAMGIMTSAVLDDVGCLILVAILIPIIVNASPKESTPETVSTIPEGCSLFPDVNASNVTGVVRLSASAWNIAAANASAWSLLEAAFASDFVTDLGTPASFLVLNWFNLTSDTTVDVSFDVAPSTLISLTPNSVNTLLGSLALPSTSLIYQESTPTNSGEVSITSFNVDNQVFPSSPSTSFLDVLWIIGKVAIFFSVVLLLHNVILPDHVEEGCLSKIPILRTYGMRHLLNACNGQQVPLTIVSFGLGLGMVGAALGFHPAVGAYFAGLILEEKYFDMLLPDAPDPTGEPVKCTPKNDNDDNDDQAGRRAQGDASEVGESELSQIGFTRSQIGMSLEELEEDRDSEPELPNTMETAKEAVGSAAFMWLGPVFFVNLGASIEIDASLLATGIPQALGMAAILWVGQFISATLSARFVPGGFSWPESALVGFGMLGRAELYFVVLNVAKSEGILENKIFFPMAMCAMFMNISLPISISLFKSVFARHHPEDCDDIEVKESLVEEPIGSGGDQGPSITIGTPRGSEGGRSKLSTRSKMSRLSAVPGAKKKVSAIARRGIGLGGFEAEFIKDEPQQFGIYQRPPDAIRNRSAVSDRSPSNISRQNSTVARRRGSEIGDMWAEPEMPAYLVEAQQQEEERKMAESRKNEGDESVAREENAPFGTTE